jgi:rubredoxin
LGEEIHMKNAYMTVEWQSGGGETVEIGYLNLNDQQCCGHCGVRGTDHEQYAYKVECAICGYVYGANGADMHERRCPARGAPGIRYWKTIKS